ncbi:MAG: Kazal-type serine protease inhibitor domain-containing protein [Polyangiales bacterium]
MTSTTRFSLFLVAALSAALVGCDETTGHGSQNLAFCEAGNACASGCSSVDSNADGCAERCEMPQCETFAPVDCGGATPIDADGDGCARECPGAGATCGGLLGSACASGEYCDFPLEARCGAADATGVCRPIPEACATVAQPVCGCDGRTYGNECEAHRAGVAVVRWGGCEPVVCPAYAPDCGGTPPIDADGDGCALECPGAAIPCGGFTVNGPLPCPTGTFCDYVPGDLCGAADAPGTCEPIPDVCPSIHAPVCGCDGKTYSSDCDAAAHSVGVLSVGVCP